MGCVVKMHMFRAKKEDNVDTGRHKFEKEKRRRKGVIHDTHSRESSRKENHKTKRTKKPERESMEDRERNQSRTR